jgi:hypothetical protein
MKLGELLIYLPTGKFNNACMSYVDKGGIHVLSTTAKEANVQNQEKAIKVIPINKEAFIANGKSPVKYVEWIVSLVKDELGYSKWDKLSSNLYDYPSYKECKSTLKYGV